MENEAKTPANTSTNQTAIRCCAASEPAVRLFILAGILIAASAWCVLDGYILGKYPYKPAAEDINAFAGWAFNHISPLLLIPAGAIIAIIAARKLRQVVVADESSISYAGKKIAWSEVTSLDATKLKSDGILTLESPGGKITLDSWRIKQFRELVAFVEKMTPKEKLKA